MAEINGIAHVVLTVARFGACKEFYAKLLPLLGLKPVIDTDVFYYCVGGRTAFGIEPASETNLNDRFDQGRSGLHHVCFRARSRPDVDEVHAFLVDAQARIIHGPEEAPWAPGYYSVLFEDPDGIRIEINHVPGKGLLDENK